MQPLRHDTTPPTQLNPPISRAGLRQIGRLAKLRNECNNTTKHHPEIANHTGLNPIHINLKIAQILKPSTPLTTIEAKHKCSRDICTHKKASNTLSDKLRDSKNKSYDKSSKYRCKYSLNHPPATLRAYRTRTGPSQWPGLIHRRPPGPVTNTRRMDTSNSPAHRHLPSHNMGNLVSPIEAPLRIQCQRHFKNRLLHTPSPHYRRHTKTHLLSETPSLSPRQHFVS